MADRDFFLAAKLSLGNSFPVELLPCVGLCTLTRVEDMDGILVFYWFFIILDATTHTRVSPSHRKNALYPPIKTLNNV